MTYFPRIQGPIAPYNNVPIQPQNYQPSQFPIADISFGRTTIVTMDDSTKDVDPNYVVGQLVHLLIPAAYGSSQLNGKIGYVISIPSSVSVEIDIVSSGTTTFIPSPYSTVITGASQTNPGVLTVDHAIAGKSILIQDVGGMTQLNEIVFQVLSSTANTMTINVNAAGFSVYTGGGTATVFPLNEAIAQIVAIGDISSGQINSSGRVNQGTFIPGSFINVSP